VILLFSPTIGPYTKETFDNFRTILACYSGREMLMRGSGLGKGKHAQRGLFITKITKPKTSMSMLRICGVGKISSSLNI
jgi:hypothetical protein